METTQLDDAVDSFIRFTRALPRQALEMNTGERWGAREVLIHLVFWHEQYASIATAVAAGKAPELRAGTIREINDLAVAQDAQTSVETLIARWRKASRRFVAVASQAAAPHLRIPLRVRSKAWPLADLIRAAARHIAGHQAKLEVTMKSDVAGARLSAPHPEPARTRSASRAGRSQRTGTRKRDSPDDTGP